MTLNLRNSLFASGLVGISSKTVTSNAATAS
jgi:hypothetical protein